MPQNVIKQISYDDEARINHEFRVTPYFEQRGFISDAFIDMEHSAKTKDNNSIYDAWSLLKKYNSPLLKRKIFFAQRGNYCFYHIYSQYNKILYYIAKHQLYDLRLVFTNLIRTGNFTFSKNKMTKLRKIKYFIFGNLLGLKHYSSRSAKYPDYDFIKKFKE